MATGTFDGSLTLAGGYESTGNVSTDTVTLHSGAKYGTWAQNILNGIGGSASISPGSTPTIAANATIVFDTPGATAAVTINSSGEVVVLYASVYWITWAVIGDTSLASQWSVTNNGTSIAAGTAKTVAQANNSTGGTVAAQLSANAVIAIKNTGTASAQISWASISVKQIGIGPGNAPIPDTDEIDETAILTGNMSLLDGPPIELLAESATFNAPLTQTGNTTILGGFDVVPTLNITSGDLLLQTFPVARPICGCMALLETTSIHVPATGPVPANVSGLLEGGVTISDLTDGVFELPLTAVYEFRGNVTGIQDTIWSVQVNFVTIFSAKSAGGAISIYLTFSASANDKVSMRNTGTVGVDVVSASFNVSAVGLA